MRPPIVFLLTDLLIEFITVVLPVQWLELALGCLEILKVNWPLTPIAIYLANIRANLYERTIREGLQKNKEHGGWEL